MQLNNGGVNQLPQNQQLSNAVAAAVNSVGVVLPKNGKKKDRLDGVLCFRCEETGHFAADCTAELCLYCDSAKHASAVCHLHAMPKPVATMYGLCSDSLLFFHGSRTPGVKSKRSSGKVGRIRVDGEALSIQQIIKELSFLIPGNHQWEVTVAGENS